MATQLDFYNTTNLETPELTEEIKNAVSGEKRVKECFLKYRGYLNPFQVQKLTGMTCINSTRRCMSNLTAKGFLRKTKVMSKGDFSKPNHTWCLNDDNQ